MGFRAREKQRLVPLKEDLFSAEACKAGIYRGKEYEFCLQNDHASENLHDHIRKDAVRYFKKRNIPWHDAIEGGPSNHLCCSQSACVNFWFPFGQAPEALAAVLRELGYDAAEMLPFEADAMPSDDGNRYVAFEWIGMRNYLNEHLRSRKAKDAERQRGQNFTSLDFAFRFRRSDDRIQIVAGEWKYTERYANGRCIQHSPSGTDRLEEFYAPAFDEPDCQIALNGLRREALFFDPFDQLMRQQLLCSAMERHGEMGADVVSLLHVAPAANRDFVGRVTSPELRRVGGDVHEIWKALVRPGRFTGVYVEDLVPVVCRFGPEPGWAAYMAKRYGGME